MLNRSFVALYNCTITRDSFNALPTARRSNFGTSIFHCRALGDEENQAINSSRESVMCIARSCITNGALHLIVKFVALLANPFPQMFFMALDELRTSVSEFGTFRLISYLLFDEGNRLCKRQTSICPNSPCWKSFRC